MPQPRLCGAIILSGGSSIGITSDGLVGLIDPREDAVLKGRIHKSFSWVDQEEREPKEK